MEPAVSIAIVENRILFFMHLISLVKVSSHIVIIIFYNMLKFSLSAGVLEWILRVLELIL